MPIRPEAARAEERRMTPREQASAIAATLPSRLANHVSQRLGTEATFVRWERDPRTGADTPVFAVPAHAVLAAKALGLTVEAV